MRTERRKVSMYCNVCHALPGERCLDMRYVWNREPKLTKTPHMHLVGEHRCQSEHCPGHVGADELCRQWGG